MFEEIKGWDGTSEAKGNPLAILRQRLHQQYLLDCIEEGVLPTPELWQAYQIALMPDPRTLLPDPSAN